MKLYVGNLSYDTTENELNQLFGQYGQVKSVAVITDRETGRANVGDKFVIVSDILASNNQLVDSIQLRTVA